MVGGGAGAQVGKGKIGKRARNEIDLRPAARKVHTLCIKSEGRQHPRVAQTAGSPHRHECKKMRTRLRVRPDGMTPDFFSFFFQTRSPHSFFFVKERLRFLRGNGRPASFVFDMASMVGLAASRGSARRDAAIKSGGGGPVANGHGLIGNSPRGAAPKQV